MNFKISKKQNGQRGSILVICMVLAGLGTIGVAAWATLLDARTHQAEQTQTALDRRVRFGNSLALAREVIQREYLHADRGPAAIKEYTLEGNWGRVTIDVWDEPVMGFTDATRINKTGAVPFRAFSLDANVGIDDGDFLHDFTFQLKSYSPILGGDLLCIHKNVETGTQKLEVGGDLKVEGRAMMWDADYKLPTMTARTDAAITVGSTTPKLPFLDTDDNAILPSNFPFAAQTSGAVDGAYDLSGKLNVINNADTPSNSYIGKLNEYGVNSYVVIDGTINNASGSGLDTNPPTADDAGLSALIVSGRYTRDNLAPFAPLSSDILRQLLQSTANPGDMPGIMADNQPIPDDIINPVLDYTFTVAQEAQILSDADYHAFSHGGRVFLNLNSASLPHVVLKNVSEIDVIGQPTPELADDAAAREPRIVVIMNDPGVSIDAMHLRDGNKRRVIMAVHNENVNPGSHLAIDYSGSSAFPDWHMLFEFQGVPSKWDSSTVGGVRLYGGIRSDQLVMVESGSLVIRKETEVDILETMASRTAWIETTRK